MNRSWWRQHRYGVVWSSTALLLAIDVVITVALARIKVHTGEPLVTVGQAVIAGIQTFAAIVLAGLTASYVFATSDLLEEARSDRNDRILDRKIAVYADALGMALRLRTWAGLTSNRGQTLDEAPADLPTDDALFGTLGRLHLLGTDEIWEAFNRMLAARILFLNEATDVAGPDRFDRARDARSDLEEHIQVLIDLCHDEVD